MDEKNLQQKILEIEVNLKDAQTTIKLQQKQASEYEKIIQKLKEKIRMQRDFICTHMGEEMVKELDCPLSVIPTLTQPLPPSLNKNTKRKYRSLQIINKKGKKNDRKASLENLIQPTLQSLSKINSKKGSSRWETITSNRVIDYDQRLLNNIDHTNHHINDRNHYNNNNNQQSHASNHDVSHRDKYYHNDGHKENTTSTMHSLQQHNEEPFLDFLKNHSSKSLLTLDKTLNNNNHSNRNSINYFHPHNRHHHPLVHHKRKNNETDHIWSMVPSPTSNISNRFPKTGLLSTINGKENTTISDSSPSMTSSSSSHFNNNSNKKNVYVQDSMVHWDKKKKEKDKANSDQRLPLVEFNINKQTVTGLKNSKNSDKSILSEKKNENKSYDSYLDAVQEEQVKKNTHGSTSTCAHYFENDSTSFANVKESMNKFSKHNVVYERPKTPPGFWDLTFPASPEKR